MLLTVSESQGCGLLGEPSNGQKVDWTWNAPRQTEPLWVTHPYLSLGSGTFPFRGSRGPARQTSVSCTCSTGPALRRQQQAPPQIAWGLQI